MTTTTDDTAQRDHRGHRHFRSRRLHTQVPTSAQPPEPTPAQPTASWRTIKEVTNALTGVKKSTIYASVVQAARLQQGWVKRDTYPHAGRWLIDIQSPEYQRSTQHWTHQHAPDSQPSASQLELPMTPLKTPWEDFLSAGDDPNPLDREHNEEGQEEREASDDLMRHPAFLSPYPLHITLPVPKHYWRNQLVYLLLVLQLITIGCLLLPYVLSHLLG